MPLPDIVSFRHFIFAAILQIFRFTPRLIIFAFFRAIFLCISIDICHYFAALRHFCEHLYAFHAAALSSSRFPPPFFIFLPYSRHYISIAAFRFLPGAIEFQLLSLRIATPFSLFSPPAIAFACHVSSYFAAFWRLLFSPIDIFARYLPAFEHIIFIFRFSFDMLLHFLRHRYALFRYYAAISSLDSRLRSLAFFAVDAMRMMRHD